MRLFLSFGLVDTDENYNVSRQEPIEIGYIHLLGEPYEKGVYYFFVTGMV